jgi:hypothetical protein
VHDSIFKGDSSLATIKSEIPHQFALECLLNNDWDNAHRIIQTFSDPLSCRIHGLLHRIEGDLDNASYWYSEADLSIPGNSLEQEIASLWRLAESHSSQNLVAS